MEDETGISVRENTKMDLRVRTECVLTDTKKNGIINTERKEEIFVMLHGKTDSKFMV